MFCENISTKKPVTNCKILFVLFFALGSSFLTAQNIFGQTSQPTPTPQSDEIVEVGAYKIKSSIELGVRGRRLDGSENKFRSDLNYKSGFRIFNSSFLMQDKDGKNKYFDTLLVNSSGWGADPTGYTRVNLERNGFYRFDANVRKITYFNNLNNHALNEHTQNTRNNMGDFDLTVFPQSEKLRLNFGYSYDRYAGPGGWTVRAYSDEFPIVSNNDTRTNDFRAGVEGKLLGFNLGLTQGYRYFRDDTNYLLTAPNVGNNPTNNAALATFSRQMPVYGDTYYTLFNAHRNFAKKVDFTARVIYSSTATTSSLIEKVTGRDNSNNQVDLDQFNISGNAKRIQTRSDLGLTFFATKDFTISETINFDKFAINGGENFAEQLARRNAAGSPLATTFTRSNAYRVTDYRRFTNMVEGDYQFNNRVGFHIGYRYTNRRIELTVFNLTLTSPTSSTNPLNELVEESNQTNTLIAGMKIKPTKNWVVFWDLEHGSADNVFTRLANYKFTNFRGRSRLSFNKVTLNVSAISKDNSNPSRTLDVLPSDFGASIKSRIYSGTITYSPIAKLSFETGYTYTHQTSGVAIFVPVNGVILQGFSQFFVRDHYAYLDVYAQPFKRVTLYGSYRISKDLGQGNRLSTATQNFVNSYPLQFQSPEFRIEARLTKNIYWNIGYQYYNYREKFQRTQDYKAHLPYTSLRIYFGGADR
ncbi:MAG: hypothetical protein ABJA66_01970 [Actinomycetota bacterium]